MLASLALARQPSQDFKSSSPSRENTLKWSSSNPRLPPTVPPATVQALPPKCPTPPATVKLLLHDEYLWPCLYGDNVTSRGSVKPLKAPLGKRKKTVYQLIHFYRARRRAKDLNIIIPASNSKQRRSEEQKLPSFVHFCIRYSRLCCVFFRTSFKNKGRK